MYTFCNTPQCRRIMMLARRRCAPCSAHFACPAYLARLAVEWWWWWWWIDLFIQPYADPEWILTAAGLFYIYDRNPVPRPPCFVLFCFESFISIPLHVARRAGPDPLSPPPFPRSYFPPPPPLPMAIGRLLPSVQV